LPRPRGTRAARARREVARIPPIGAVDWGGAPVHSIAVAARRTPHDALRLGEAPKVPGADAGDSAVLLHRTRNARTRPLPLAGRRGGSPRAGRAARPRRFERLALRPWNGREGVPGRLQRPAPQPAQLRRDRAPHAGAVSLGADGRRPVGHRGTGDRGRPRSGCGLRFLARRQRDAPAGRTLRRRASRVAARRVRRLTHAGPRRLHGPARAALEPSLRVELHVGPAPPHPQEGPLVPRPLRRPWTLARADDSGLRRPLHRARRRVRRRGGVLRAGVVDPRRGPRIRVPTLIISAEDDPFIPPAPLRDPRVAGNPAITVVAERYGGHCGFVEAPRDGYDGFWAEAAVVEFALPRARAAANAVREAELGGRSPATRHGLQWRPTAAE